MPKFEIPDDAQARMMMLVAMHLDVPQASEVNFSHREENSSEAPADQRYPLPAAV
jgi:hypothetical protein